jgi:hypothetical protein
MVSARRFRELKVGPEDAEIATAPPIGVIPRMIQAEELMPKQLAASITELNGANHDGSDHDDRQIA